MILLKLIGSPGRSRNREEKTGNSSVFGFRGCEIPPKVSSSKGGCCRMLFDEVRGQGCALMASRIVHELPDHAVDFFTSYSIDAA
jgi:hypothetical protein